MSAGSVSAESSLWGCTFSLYPHRASPECAYMGEGQGQREGQGALYSSSYKATRPTGLGTHPYDLTQL